MSAVGAEPIAVTANGGTVPFMISFLRGTPIDDTTLLVGDVGYTVHTPEGLDPDGGPVDLFITTVVTDSAMTLYGFGTRTERQLCALIVKAPGVGAKMALALLRTLGAAGAAAAISRGDDKAIATTPGIGAKTAKGLIAAVTIPDALLALLDADAVVPATPADDQHPVVGVLVNLGFPEAKANDAVTAVLAADPSVDEETLIRSSIAHLSADAA